MKPKAGLPTVAEKDGMPVITVPKTDPPTTLQVQPLIKGKGKKVGRERHHHLRLPLGALERRQGAGGDLQHEAGRRRALSGLLPGMVKGLTGQTVGSRVLLVIPPADGYPDGNPTPSVGPGETLVMVVDLLFTSAAVTPLSSPVDSSRSAPAWRPAAAAARK